MAAMAMRLTPKVRISPPIWKVRGAPSGATVLPEWQIPCRTIVRSRARGRDVTELLHNLPSLLAVHAFNARDICFRTAAVFARLPRPHRTAFGALSLSGDIAGAERVFPPRTERGVTGLPRRPRLAGRGGRAHIGRPQLEV
jgi:hypothetical protein